MKKLSLVLAIMAFATISCNSVEQFRAPIEELAGNWETITNQVGDFATTLQSEQTNAAGLLAQMVIPDGVDLGEEATGQAQGFIAQATEQLSSVTTLGATVASFLEGWGDNTDALEDLQDGLEAGSIDGDVMAQINSLKEAITGAEGSLDGWRAQLTSATTGLQSAYDSFAALLPAQEEEVVE